jgi:hypothetical protein
MVRTTKNPRSGISIPIDAMVGTVELSAHFDSMISNAPPFGAAR